MAGKPSPAMLIELTRRTQTTLDKWVVVGDGLDSDVAMAKAAGVPCTLIGTDKFPDLRSLVSAVVAGGGDGGAPG